MKKKFVLISLIAAFVFPVFGEASTPDVTPVVQNSTVTPRAVFMYIFPSVPPKTFNGRNRIYYEYRAKDKVYIGYYQ